MARPITDPFLKRSTASLILISNGLLALSFTEHCGTIDGLLYDSRLLVANGMTPLVAMKLQKAWMAATKWTLQHPFTRVLYSTMLVGGIYGDSVLLQMPWLLSSFVETAAQLVVVLASFWIMLFYMEPMTVPHVLSVTFQLFLIQVYSGMWTLIALWTFQSAIEEMIEVLAVSRGPAVLLTYDPNTQRMSARELHPNQPIWAIDQGHEQQLPRLPGVEDAEEENLSQGPEVAVSGVPTEDRRLSEGITRGPEIEVSPESTPSSSLAGYPSKIDGDGGEITSEGRSADAPMVASGDDGGSTPGDADESTRHAPVDASLDVEGSTPGDEDKSTAPLDAPDVEGSTLGDTDESARRAVDAKPVSGVKKKPCEPDSPHGICPPDWHCHSFRDGHKNYPAVMAEPETHETPEDVAEEDKQEHTVDGTLHEEPKETEEEANVNSGAPDSTADDAESPPDARKEDDATSDLERESKDGEKNLALSNESCKKRPPRWYCRSSHIRKGEFPDRAIVDSEYPEDIRVEDMGDQTMDPIVYEEEAKETEGTASNIPVDTSNIVEENTEGGANAMSCVDSVGNVCKFSEGPGRCTLSSFCQSRTRKGELPFEEVVESEHPEDVTVWDTGPKTMDATSNIEEENAEFGANAASCVDSLGNLCKIPESLSKCQQFCQLSPTRKEELPDSGAVETGSTEGITVEEIGPKNISIVEENTEVGANVASCVDSFGKLCKLSEGPGICPQSSQCHQRHKPKGQLRITFSNIDQFQEYQEHLDRFAVAEDESAVPGYLDPTTDEKNTGRTTECAKCDPCVKDQRSKEALDEVCTNETQSTKQEETSFSTLECKEYICELEALCQRARGDEFAIDHSTHDAIVDETRIAEDTRILHGGTTTMADTSDEANTEVMDNREKYVEESSTLYEDWRCPPDAPRDIEGTAICSNVCGEMSDKRAAENTTIDKEGRCLCKAESDQRIELHEAVTSHTDVSDRVVTEDAIVGEEGMAEERNVETAVTEDITTDEVEATPYTMDKNFLCPPGAMCQAGGPTECPQKQSATTNMTDKSEVAEDRMTEDVQEAEHSDTGEGSTWYDAADNWVCPRDAYCQTGEGFPECEAAKQSGAMRDTQNIAEMGGMENEPGEATVVVEDITGKCLCRAEMGGEMQEEHEQYTKDDNRNHKQVGDELDNEELHEGNVENEEQNREPRDNPEN